MQPAGSVNPIPAGTTLSAPPRSPRQRLPLLPVVRDPLDECRLWLGGHLRCTSARSLRRRSPRLAGSASRSATRAAAVSEAAHVEVSMVYRLRSSPAPPRPPRRSGLPFSWTFAVTPAGWLDQQPGADFPPAPPSTHVRQASGTPPPPVLGILKSWPAIRARLATRPSRSRCNLGRRRPRSRPSRRVRR